MRRRYAREKALQVLFQMDVGKTEREHALQSLMEHEPDLSEEIRFIRDLVEGTEHRLGEIDALLRRCCVGWDLDRMANVDRNVLRIAAYEMLAMPQTPVGVVMNEAVEIAKRYGTPESGKFVNGVLARVGHALGNSRASEGVGGSIDG